LKTGLSVIAVNGVLLDVDDRPVDIRLLATVARLSRPTNTQPPHSSTGSNGRSATNTNKSKTQGSRFKMVTSSA